MTNIEKEVCMRALRCYSDQQKRRIKKYLKTGDSKNVAQCRAEYNLANGGILIFSELLTIPCGKAMI